MVKWSKYEYTSHRGDVKPPLCRYGRGWRAWCLWVGQWWSRGLDRTPSSPPPYTAPPLCHLPCTVRLYTLIDPPPIHPTWMCTLQYWAVSLGRTTSLRPSVLCGGLTIPTTQANAYYTHNTGQCLLFPQHRSIPTMPTPSPNHLLVPFRPFCLPMENTMVFDVGLKWSNHWFVQFCLPVGKAMVCDVGFQWLNVTS